MYTCIKEIYSNVSLLGNISEPQSANYRIGMRFSVKKMNMRFVNIVLHNDKVRKHDWFHSKGAWNNRVDLFEYILDKEKFFSGDNDGQLESS